MCAQRSLIHRVDGASAWIAMVCVLLHEHSKCKGIN